MKPTYTFAHCDLAGVYYELMKISMKPLDQLEFAKNALGEYKISLIFNSLNHAISEETVAQIQNLINYLNDFINQIREQLETRAQAAAIIGKRVSTAEDPEERAFLEDNLKLLGEVGAPTTSRLKQAEITVYPGEQNLTFVVQKDNPRPAFNVLTRLTNSGQQVGIVDGLEAILTDPEGVSFRFVWNLFYGVRGLEHKMSSYIHPIAIPPGGSNLLGIQFIGPDLGIAKLYSWPAGRYQVEMTGWVNRSHDRRPTNLSSKFYIDISSKDIARLKEWIGWDDAAWKLSGVSDNAVGHPVRIVRG